MHRKIVCNDGNWISIGIFAEEVMVKRLGVDSKITYSFNWISPLKIKIDTKIQKVYLYYYYYITKYDVTAI